MEKTLTAHSKLSWEERTCHIDLSSPCHLDSTVCWRTNNLRLFDNLLSLLQLVNDSSNRKTDNINVLHHCSNDTLNGCCTNPKHCSFGTHKENTFMITPEDRSKRAKLACSRQTSEQLSDRVKKGHEKRTSYHRTAARFTVLVTSPEGVSTQISGVNNAAKFIGCNPSTIKCALSRSGTITKGPFKNWSIKKL